MINENSLWSDDKEKESFLKSPTKIGNAFWTNLIGFSALYNIDKDFTLLQQYFKQQVRLKTINDDSGDLFYIIKVHVDKGNISEQVGNEITRYMAILKTGKLDEIDVPEFRKLLKKIKVSKVKMSAKMKPYIVDFITGASSLNDMIDPLYAFALKQKTSSEFRQIAKRMRPSISTDIDDKPVSVTKPSKPTTKNTVSSTNISVIISDTIANDQMNENFPLYKGNKDLSKLFLLKLINGKYMYKKRPNSKNYISHMKKFGTTADDLKMIITNDDFKNMFDNNFPENHPELKIFSQKSNLFKPITDDLFDDHEISRFQKLFNYKFWWIKYLEENYDHDSIYVLIDKIGDSFNNEDFDIIKNNIKPDILNLIRDQPKKILEKFKQYPNWNDYWSDILYKEDSFIWYGAKVFINSFSNAIDDMWSLKWVEKWYNATSETNRKLLIDMALSNKIIDKMTFIDQNDINKDDIEYTKFTNWIRSDNKKPGYSYFREIDIKDWLKKRNKLNDFIKDFESSKYDNIFNTTFEFFGRLAINKIEWFILNRSRDFKIDPSSSLLKSVLKGNNGKDILNKIVNQMIKDKIKIDLMSYRHIVRNLNDTNYIEFFENCVSKVGNLKKLALPSSNISGEYIDKNKDRFIKLLDTDQIMLFFNEVISYKDYLVITKSEIIEMRDRYPKDIKFLFKRIINIKSTDINPSDRYKEIMGFILQELKKDLSKNGDDYNDAISIVSSIILSNNVKTEDFLNDFKDEMKNSYDLFTVSLRASNRNNILFEAYSEDEIIENIEKAVADKGNNNRPQNILSIVRSLHKFKDINNIKKIFDNQSILLNFHTFFKTNTSTLLTEYKFLDIIQLAIDKLPPDEFDDLLSKMFDGIKETTYINAIRKKFLMSAVVEEIFDDKRSLIRPLEKLSPKRLNEVLKFNDVSVKLPPALRRKKNEPTAVYFKRIIKNHHQLEAIEPLKVDRIVETDEQLERKTAEYIKYYNFKHGNSAIEIIESYDVNMPSKELEEFTKAHPKPTVIPFFHGTGSIGASMILRYGFKILKSTDSMVVGRMLGDGIYISNIIEKAAQYIGDKGFSRREGTIGYILEGDAYIGEERVHYRSAGTGNDRIISPEWVIFDARAQLHIKKAHKVIMTNKKHIKDLAKKYNVDIKESIQDNLYLTGYRNLLTEEKQPNNLITYIFYDGNCIDHNKNIIAFEDFMELYKSNKNIIVSYGQLGPEVNIKTSSNVIGSVHIPYTSEFVLDDPEDLFDQYMTILTNAIEGEYQE